MGVPTQIWRARIGSFHQRCKVEKDRTQDPSLLPAIAFLLLMLMICAGDVETNPGPMQLQCRKCNYRCHQPLKLFRHQLIHRNIRNFRHQCPVNENCKQSFTKFGAFKTHIYRSHSSQNTNQVTRVSVPFGPRTLACPVSNCNELFTNEDEVKQHCRRTHLKRGTAVPCIVPGCRTILKTVNYFKVHLSRDHKEGCHMSDVNHPPPVHEGRNVSTINVDPGSAHEEQDDTDNTTEEQEEEFMDCDDDDDQWVTDQQFVKAISEFYLKLVTKKQIPDDVVQTICEDFRDLLEINHQRQKEKLGKLLVGLEIPPEQAEEVLTEFSNSDVLHHTHCKGKELGYTKLNTIHLRFEHVKENFTFISPELVDMAGMDNIGRKINAFIVAFRNTITELINHPDMEPIIEDSFQNQPRDDDIISDFMDGDVYKSSPYAGKRVIRLFGYQDAFEVCVPIGAAKLLHKMIGWYYCIANLPPHLRMKLDMIQLAMLVKTTDWKIPGVRKRCWDALTKQLKELEVDGVEFKREKIPVILECFMGDNEGCHHIGGYAEGFSATHNCRYCDVSEAEILQDPTLFREFRTPQEFDHAAALMAMEPPGSRKKHHEGVSRQSPLNELPYFHVSNAGLAPCLYHDTHEGLAQYDMVLLIKSLILAKWFTIKELNGMILKFKCKAPDSGDRPAGGFTEDSTRLKGNAVQNKNFVRFFPLIIQGKIKDDKCQHWQMYLKLKAMLEIMSAPQVSVEQVHFMRVLTEDYISTRITLYPHVPLRRKHHYVLHYPQFILKRGPVVRYHTLQCESKHGTFKKKARASKNYINPTLNLANHHQLNFAYMMTGPLQPEFEVSKSQPLKIETFIKPIEDLLTPLNFSQDAEELKFVKIQNIKYKPSQYLILNGTGQTHSMNMYVGEIWSILNDKGKVHFVLKKSLAEFSENDGLHHIRKRHDDFFVCVEISACKDHNPYAAYNFGSDQCLTLKHTFPFM